MVVVSTGRKVYELIDRTLLSYKLWTRFIVVVFVISVTAYAIFTHIANMPAFNLPFPADKKERINCNLEEDTTSYEELELDVDRLFYNRVPKSASTTLYLVMKKLSTANKYVHYNSKIYNGKIMNEEEQNRFVWNVTNTPAPCSFDRHVFFVDFSKFGAKSPVYINLIRDPVERIISSYFYRRSVAREGHFKIKPSEYWLNKSFRHCVDNGDHECTFVDGEKYHVLLLPYFCGQDERCLILNEPWALRKAKRNIELYYAVVGVVEELNMTLRVLEATLPRFFKGATSIYKNESRRNENHHKQRVDDDIKVALKANLTAEYDLYYFVLQRLYRQFRDLSLNSL